MSFPRIQRRTSHEAVFIFMFTVGVWKIAAQPSSFAADAQHSGLYGAPAQHLNVVKWSTQIDVGLGSASGTHYGAPVISLSNTVFVPTLTNSGPRVRVKAFDGATGRFKYTLVSDYIFPSSTMWIPVYQPVISTPASGPRLYYPGAGGTTYYVTNIDSDFPSAPVHECFYTDIAIYGTNTTGFNNSVFISTPLTADSQGDVFFAYRVSGTAPPPFGTTSGGIARLGPEWPRNLRYCRTGSR